MTPESVAALDAWAAATGGMLDLLLVAAVQFRDILGRDQAPAALARFGFDQFQEHRSAGTAGADPEGNLIATLAAAASRLADVRAALAGEWWGPPADPGVYSPEHREFDVRMRPSVDETVATVVAIADSAIRDGGPELASAWTAMAMERVPHIADLSLDDQITHYRNLTSYLATRLAFVKRAIEGR